MQKISYNTCKQQNLYAIENNSKAHNIMQHQNIYNEHQKNATPKYLKIECNKICIQLKITQKHTTTKNTKVLIVNTKSKVQHQNIVIEHKNSCTPKT